VADGDFVSFADFLNATRSAEPQQYAGRAEGVTRTDEEFEQLKQHVLGLYDGAEPVHSFVTREGQYVDCIPIAQQPSMRAAGPDAMSLQPPDAPIDPPEFTQVSDSEDVGAGDENGDVPHEPVGPQFDAGESDDFGNLRECPDGTIGMLRISLETVTRFRNLEDFLRRKTAPPVHPAAAPAATVHKYAYARQTVDNLGGNSGLNLWSPAVATGEFALSQQWYSAGSGAGHQTVEGGVQVYPQLFGTNLACPFVFWTSANYTNGCYNLTCTGFVQTSNKMTLGVPWAAQYYSTDGGTQYDVVWQWKLAGRAWWLFVFLSNGWNAIGYYPTSLYGTGPLATKATDITYGGETTGATSWGPMGSGKFANTGWSHAAYQRQIFYIDTSSNSQWANLTKQQPSAACYTIDLKSSSDNTWGKYFYFGGPGGNRC
jgi:hypothetical protein